jgi:hypothetical protein
MILPFSSLFKKGRREIIVSAIISLNSPLEKGD